MSKYNVLIYGMTYNYGGVESVIMNYYRNMKNEKIHFDFMCVNDQMAYEDEVKENNSKVYKIGSKARNPIKYRRNIKKFFKENSQKYDAIWFNVCTLVNIDALKLAKRYGIATRIVHSHNSNMDYGFIKNFIHKMNKISLKKYANVYWACSDVAAEYLFGDNKDYRVINNAIKVDNFIYNEKTRRKVRNELNIKDSTLVVGNVGRFDEQKNHKFLIDIFNEVRKQNENTVLLLAGQGPLQGQIKEKVHELGLTEAVKFLGQRNDVNELYQAMDLFLFPSLYEGLGMVAIEAQCAGLPCVCSTEVPEVAKVSKCFVRIDLSEEKQVWVQYILKYLNTTRKDSKLNIEQYDIKKEASKLQKLLEEIIINARKE